MRLAKIVFLIAGLWGLLILAPFFFLFDYIGRHYPPAITHPEFYFGFLTVTLAWQFAFLAISRDPVRHRSLMLPAMVEKFAYIAALAALYAQSRIPFAVLSGALPDLILGILFIAAFVNTR